MSSSRLLPCHDTVFEACVDGRNLLPGSAASLRLSRSRLSVRSVSRIIRPRSFYLSRSGSRMNGDDRRRSRRWNEVKPFRAAAPAWLPAFQAPANLLQYERARTHGRTHTSGRVHRRECSCTALDEGNEREEDTSGNGESERRGNADEWDWIHHSFSKLARPSPFRELSSAPVSDHDPSRPINDRPSYSQRDQRALAAKRAPVGGLIG